MSEHAKISPSAAERWTNCTASPLLEAGLPDNGSDAADTGSCYHAVADIILRRLTTPALAAGNIAKVEMRRAFHFAFETVKAQGTGSITGERATLLMNYDEAEDQAKTYATWILGVFGKAIAKGAAFGIEGVSVVSDNIWGTVDFWCLVGSRLHIVDLKTGRWPVSQVDNKQLKTYAAGILGIPGLEIAQEVTLTIFQGGKPWTWDTTASEIANWRVKLRRYEDEITTGGVADAGDWCKFCKAKTTCSKFATRALDAAANEFAPVSYGMPETTIENIDGELAAQFLNNFAMIEGFITAALPLLAERAYSEGLEIPGYKVVRGMKHKAWQDKEAAGKALGPDAFKQTILTPNQAIKKLGDEACTGLWLIPTGELKLVTEGTRGKAVTRTAAIEFAD